MKCPNCSNEVPETANVCGYCGQRLKAPSTAKRKQSVPQSQPQQRASNWILGIGIVGIAGFMLVAFFGAALLFTTNRNVQPMVPTGTRVAPTQIKNATAEEPSLETTPVLSPTQSNALDRCGLFDDTKMRFTYPAWKRGSPPWWSQFKFREEFPVWKRKPPMTQIIGSIR